ncbi:MAG: hypothetical protein U0359_14035 [Byssovorax sp.]
MASRSDADNRANQLNPNNPAYWSSRGIPQPAPVPARSPSEGGTPTGEHLPGVPPPAPAPVSPGSTK